MPFTLENHRLMPARLCLSPNRDERPRGEVISLLVIHNISLPPGAFGQGHIEAFFCNHLETQRHPYFESIASLQVSAHLLIDRSGQVTQFVPFDQRAWHAGRSCFRGREGCNDFSIGIELEGTDNQPYTDAQYLALAAIVRLLKTTYPAIDAQAIKGHSDIAPGRKTDPGPAFDWPRLHQLLV
jgi:AmpD protein